MRNGFTFKNCHSSGFNVTVKTKSRPIRPEQKTYTTDIPCRDGIYDFSAANEYGRVFYNDRIFAVTIYVSDENLEEMQFKLSELSRWLCGSGDLIFDDIPLIVWKGRVSDEIIYMPENSGKKAVIEVSFRAEPFGYCIFDNDGPTLDTALRIDSNLPLDISPMFLFSLSGRGEMKFINFGDRPVLPLMTINGNAEGVRLDMDGKTLSFNTNGNTEVDFKNHTVTCGGESIKVAGEFFEFKKGTNLITLENSNTSELSVNFVFTPEFMYNVHFYDVDWGDGDA